jgi:hypothetical protein
VKIESTRTKLSRGLILASSVACACFSQSNLKLRHAARSDGEAGRSSGARQHQNGGPLFPSRIGPIFASASAVRAGSRRELGRKREYVQQAVAHLPEMKCLAPEVKQVAPKSLYRGATTPRQTFDDGFKVISRAIVFTFISSGYYPRCALDCTH